MIQDARRQTVASACSGSPRRRRRGFALIYVMWVVATLSLLLLSHGDNRPVNPQAADNLRTEAIARIELDRVLRYAVERLVDREIVVSEAFARAATERMALSLRRRRDDADLGQALADLRTILQQLDFEADFLDDITLGAAPARDARIESEAPDGAVAEDEEPRLRFNRLFSPSPEVRSLAVGDHVYQVRLIPEAALPSLNRLEETELARVLAYHGLAEAVAEQWAALLLDWQDSNDESRPGSTQRLAAALPPGAPEPRNGPILTFEELAFLEPVGGAHVAWLRERFSLQTASRRLPIRYVEPGLAAALTEIEPDRFAAAREVFLDEGETALRTFLGPVEAPRFLALFARDAPREGEMRLHLIHPSGASLTATILDQAVLARWDG